MGGEWRIGAVSSRWYHRDMDTDTPIKRKTRDAIRKVYEAEMGRFGLIDVKIWPDEDHYGDPVIRAEGIYMDNGVPVDLEIVADLLLKVNDAAGTTGEKRFVHPRNRFAPSQRALKREFA
jgi:hypothetical protein